MQKNFQITGGTQKETFLGIDVEQTEPSIKIHAIIALILCSRDVAHPIPKLSKRSRNHDAYDIAGQDCPI